MVRLYAEYRELSNYGKLLADKSKELTDLYNDMYQTVLNIKNASWSGVDYDSYFEKYLTYLSNLKKVIEEVESFSSFTLGKTRQYDNTESKFNSEIGARS